MSCIPLVGDVNSKDCNRCPGYFESGISSSRCPTEAFWMVLAWQKGVAEAHLTRASRAGSTREVDSESWVKAEFCESDGNVGYAAIY